MALLPSVPTLGTSRRSLVVPVPWKETWTTVVDGGADAWHRTALPLRFRALVDLLAGGEGAAWPAPGRPLRAGDRSGFWIVLEAEARTLALRASVRSPVDVTLRTTVAEPRPGRSRITQEVSVGIDDPLGAAYAVADLPARELLLLLVQRRLRADVLRAAARA